MSLILDALRRAERERQTAPAQMLSGAPPSSGRAPPRRWARRALLAAIAMALAAPVLWWVMREPPAPAVAPPARSVAAPARIVAPPAPPPFKVEVPAPAPAVVPGTEGVASLEEVAPEATLAPPPGPAAPAPGANPAGPATPAPAEARAPATAQDDTRDEDPEERPVPQALRQAAPLRNLREMPPEYRSDFPPLSVDVHVYHAQPDQRFVLIGGRRYRERERLAEGPAILEIVRGGIVFDYRGEKVLYTLTRD